MIAGWFADLLARSRFLARYPQFAALVATLEPLAIEAVETMGIARHRRVDGSWGLRLYVASERMQQDLQAFRGLLQHQLHHVLCGHLDDERLHEVEHPWLMEMAMEMTANEFIVEPVPGAPVDLATFEDLGIRPRQSTMQRYELLVKAMERGQLLVYSADQLDELDPDWRQKLRDPSGPGGQRILVLQRPDHDGRWKWNHIVRPRLRDNHRLGALGGDRGLGDALDRRTDRARGGTWKNSDWLGPPTSPVQIESWQREIRAFLRGDAGGGGDAVTALPAAKELPRELAITTTGALAWPRLLRQLLPTRRLVQPSYLRPSRRFPTRLGELPGRVRRQARPRLLIGLDTSASMAADVLGACAAELPRLRSLADLTIAEVDAAVHRVYRRGEPDVVVGGGDTDFHPLFRLLQERRDFDAVVYFTDGAGAWPSTPPGVPVLWVLTSRFAFDCPWGTVVRLPQAGC